MGYGPHTPLSSQLITLERLLEKAENERDFYQVMCKEHMAAIDEMLKMNKRMVAAQDLIKRWLALLDGARQAGQDYSAVLRLESDMRKFIKTTVAGGEV